MSAVGAVDFLIKDHGDINKNTGDITGFRKDFADDEPYRSILQRSELGLEEILDMFSWDDDNNAWIEEYNKPGDQQDMTKLVRYRRRIAFLIGGWREFNEDFGRGDVSCLRDIRTPLVTSRSPLKSMRDEFYEN